MNREENEGSPQQDFWKLFWETHVPKPICIFYQSLIATREHCCCATGTIPHFQNVFVFLKYMDDMILVSLQTVPNLLEGTGTWIILRCCTEKNCLGEVEQGWIPVLPCM